MWCWCDEWDKPVACITSEECDDGCCDSCMHCVLVGDDMCEEDQVCIYFVWSIMHLAIM